MDATYYRERVKRCLRLAALAKRPEAKDIFLGLTRESQEDVTKALLRIAGKKTEGHFMVMYYRLEEDLAHRMADGKATGDRDKISTAREAAEALFRPNSQALRGETVITPADAPTAAERQPPRTPRIIARPR